ncbi:MAG: 3'-5' exonuclease, partial [Eggerthellaceae bacterium]|nr:3'-5' exonuclease [Eggerthellaceae bacterium]
MGRRKAHTRRTPKARPSGILELSSDGYGFVSTAEGEFFVPASKTAGAFDGDVVEVAPSNPKAHGPKENRASGAGRPSARVLRILERAHETLVGRYEVADPFGVVIPQDRRIPYDVFTMRSESPDVPDGAIVRVRMVEYPSRNTAATGVVEEVLGMDGAPGMDIEAIVARHRLETRFSDDAIAQAADAQVDVL